MTVLYQIIRKRRKNAHSLVTVVIKKLILILGILILSINLYKLLFQRIIGCPKFDCHTFLVHLEWIFSQWIPQTMWQQIFEWKKIINKRNLEFYRDHLICAFSIWLRRYWLKRLYNNNAYTKRNHWEFSYWNNKHRI